MTRIPLRPSRAINGVGRLRFMTPIAAKVMRNEIARSNNVGFPKKKPLVVNELGVAYLRRTKKQLKKTNLGLERRPEPCPKLLDSASR